MLKNEKAIGYQMTKKMFDSILSTRNEAEKKQNPYQYAMSYLNEQHGLRGKVTSIQVVDV